MKRVVSICITVLAFWGICSSVELVASSGAMHAASIECNDAATIVGIAAPGNQAQRLYIPYPLYNRFTQVSTETLFVPLDTVKSVVKQFTCARPLVEIATIVRDTLLEHQCLEDGGSFIILTLLDETICVVPASYFSVLGLAVPRQDSIFGVDRQSMRAFLHVMTFLHTSLFGKPIADRQRLMEDKFIFLGRPQDKKRFIRVLYATGTVPAWIVAAFRLTAPESGDDDSVESDDSDGYSGYSDAISDSGFSGPDDSRTSGRRVKKHNLAFFLRQRGMAYLRQSLHVGADGYGFLDFSEFELTSMDGFGAVLQSVFPISELCRVRGIDLSKNLLRTIPERAFAALPELRGIDLTNNPLESVHDQAFSGVSRLESLAVSVAPALTSIPSAVWTALPQLKDLSITGTSISDFSEIVSLKFLERVDLSNNKITKIPCFRELPALTRIDLMGNFIADLGDESCFPCKKDGTFAFQLLQLDNNQLTSLPSWFYDRLPDVGACITMCNNQFVEYEPTEAELLKAGFERVGDASIASGRLVAGGISEAIFVDVRDKLCTYLGAKNSSIPSIVCDEIGRKRQISCINPMPAEESFLKRNAGTIACVAATVVLFAVGGGALGYFFIKKAAMKVAVKIAVGAAIGAGVGAAAGGIGAAVFGSTPPRGSYLNTGGATVCMSEALKKVYIGVFREVALLSLLKQYLVATATLLDWLASYDEYAANPRRIDLLMCGLESDINLARKQLFARIDDATTIALLHELVSENPMTEIKHHVPTDLFDTDVLDRIDFAKDADLVWLGNENMCLIRSVIQKFASAARLLRSALVNRYIGTFDHSKVASMLCKVPDLQDALLIIKEGVCAPLVKEMERLGETSTAWYDDMQGFSKVATKLEKILKKLAKHKHAISLIRSL